MSLAIVFDDELLVHPKKCVFAGRDIENERDITVKSFDGTRDVTYKSGSFDEYAQLWARYMRLSVEVIKRNQYIFADEPQRKVIPRIQALIAQQTDASRAQELREYEQYHINVWEQMEEVIDALCKNDYVKRRTHYKRRELQAFRQGLYDQIRE